MYLSYVHAAAADLGVCERIDRENLGRPSLDPGRQQLDLRRLKAARRKLRGDPRLGEENRDQLFVKPPV